MMGAAVVKKIHLETFYVLTLRLVLFFLCLYWLGLYGHGLRGYIGAQEPAADSVEAVTQVQASPAEILRESDIQVQLGTQEQTQANGQIAAPESGASSADRSADGSGLVSASLYLRVFLILGFLVVLIYFTLRFLRRLSLQKPQLSGLGSGIQVLSSQVLHGDRMLHVVEVGGECYLLGSGPNGVQLLDHYTEPEVKDRIILEATQDPRTRSGTLLSQGGGVALDFVKLLRERLRRGSNFASPTEEVSQEKSPESPDETTEGLGISFPHTRDYRERLRSATRRLKKDEL